MGEQWMCCICIRMHHLRKERMIQILPAAHPPIAHPPAALQPSLHLMIQRRMTSQSRQPESKNVTATTASGEKAEVTVIVTKDTAGKSNGSKCRSDRYQGRDFCRYGEQDRGSCRNRPCGNYCKMLPIKKEISDIQ